MFRGSEQVRAGRLTRAQLRSTAWRRLFPDEYACASLTIDHARRTRAAARLALPGAVVSGRSAGVLWGVDLAGPDDDVECTLAPECRAGSVRGIRVTRRALPTAEVTRRGGVPVTTVRRTALDLARIQPVDEAVVARVDLAGRKVAVEYEGVWHGQSQQVARDRRRLNDLSAAGWTIVFVTAADLRDPVQLVARIAAALTTPRYV
jgi:very-short-patch-repair endonuclease